MTIYIKAEQMVTIHLVRQKTPTRTQTMYETFHIEFQWVYFNVSDILFILFCLHRQTRNLYIYTHTDHGISRWNKQFIFLFNALYDWMVYDRCLCFNTQFKLNEMPNKIRPTRLKSISISRNRERERERNTEETKKNAQN